mgnify:FL=1|tara:strand:+ start:150 stop:794 length:645 start_codon:yes stop_codon:yes gene_type:complete
MCGRYYIDIGKDELSFVNNISEIKYEQNFNVAPQNHAPCIIDNNLVIANWGYFPDWLKSQSNSRPLFNTRYESLLEKKTFTSAFKNSRCLIPISGWYEWKEEDGIKQPYYFFDTSESLLFAAGLYWNRSSGDIETSIITREAVSSLQPIHSRSPLLLTEKQRELWLSDLSSEEIYTQILDYTYDDIEFHKVDRAVNNPKNNNDSLIRKYEEVPF